jgi:hypothetical protein
MMARQDLSLAIHATFLFVDSTGIIEDGQFEVDENVFSE